jgi:hypothetical protein
MRMLATVAVMHDQSNAHRRTRPQNNSRIRTRSVRTLATLHTHTLMNMQVIVKHKLPSEILSHMLALTYTQTHTHTHMHARTHTHLSAGQHHWSYTAVWFDRHPPLTASITRGLQALMSCCACGVCLYSGMRAQVLPSVYGSVKCVFTAPCNYAGCSMRMRTRHT